MSKMLGETVEQDKNIFKEAIIKIEEEQRLAEKSQSPGKVKRVFY